MHRTLDRSRTRGLATTALAAAALISLSACATSAEPAASSAEGEGLKIAFGNINNAATTFLPVVDAMQASTQTLGWSVDVYDNAQDAEKTLANARLMVSTQPDAIIEFNAVDGVAQALGDMFTEAGIPCIAMNGPIPGCAWFNISNEQYGKDAGTNLAEAALDLGWTAEDTTFIGLNAPAAGTNPQQLVANAYAQFTEDFPGLEAATADDVTFTTTTIGDNFIQVDGKATLIDSTNALKSTLQTIPADRHVVVVTVNDDSALGAVAAIESAGRTDDAIVAGAGSSDPGLDALRANPMWVSEGAVYLDQWADFTLAMAKVAVDGGELPELTVAPQNSLTKQTVDDYFDGYTPIAVPDIDPGTEYLFDVDVLQQLGYER